MSPATNRHSHTREEVLQCQIIDVTIPKWLQHPEEGHREDELVCNLQFQSQRIWNKKVEVISVIIGASGIVDKTIKKYVG